MLYLYININDVWIRFINKVKNREVMMYLIGLLKKKYKLVCLSIYIYS